jgi:hypothetical protein
MDDVTGTAADGAAADGIRLMPALLIDFDSHFPFTAGDEPATVPN